MKMRRESRVQMLYVPLIFSLERDLTSAHYEYSKSPIAHVFMFNAQPNSRLVLNLSMAGLDI
jgi:hypothetical protein